MFLNLSKKNIKIGGFGIKGSERPPGITDSKLSDIFSLGKSFEYMVEKRLVIHFPFFYIRLDLPKILQYRISPILQTCTKGKTSYKLFKMSFSMTTENDNETPKLTEILQNLKRTQKNKGI